MDAARGRGSGDWPWPPLHISRRPSRGPHSLSPLRTFQGRPPSAPPCPSPRQEPGLIRCEFHATAPPSPTVSPHGGGGPRAALPFFPLDLCVKTDFHLIQCARVVPRRASRTENCRERRSTSALSADLLLAPRTAVGPPIGPGLTFISARYWFVSGDGAGMARRDVFTVRWMECHPDSR